MGDTFMKRSTRDGAAAVLAASITLVLFSVVALISPSDATPTACAAASSFLGEHPQRVVTIRAEESLEIAVSDGKDTVWLNPDNGELLGVSFHEDVTASADGASTCHP